MASFVTAQQYADLLQTTVPAASSLETAVNMALDAACTEIRKELGQDIDEVTGDVMTLDGTGRRGLILPQLPVTAVNSVTIDKDLDTEIDVTDFYAGFGGILYRTGAQDPPVWFWESSPSRPRRAWPLGVANITVDYDHGYASDAIPADLVVVAIQVARATVHSPTPGGLTSETIGGYSYTRDLAAADALKQFASVLDGYRAPRVMVA